jgi:hypothetical protein
MTTTFGAIGPLRVAVVGAGPLATELRLELSPAEAGDVDLRIVLAGRGDVVRRLPPSTYSAKYHMAFGVDHLTADDPLRYALLGPMLGSPPELVIEEASERRFSRLKRLLGPQIGMQPALTYSLLWFVAHLLLVRHGSASIHASAWEEHAAAYAIAGTGGSGKTSLLFHVLHTRPEARYLAEDFALIDAGGRALPSPKSLSVFSSDIRSTAIQADAYRARMRIDRRLRWAAWSRLGAAPMVKIPVPDALAPDRIGHGAALSSLVYLIRTDEDSPQVAAVATEEVVRRLVHVGWREHKRLLELLHMVAANADAGTVLPTPAALEEMLVDRLGVALGGARTYVARVPALASPDMIVSTLREAGAIP